MSALGRLVSEGKIESVPLPSFNVEIPQDKSHGDFASVGRTVVTMVLFISFQYQVGGRSTGTIQIHKVIPEIYIKIN